MATVLAGLEHDDPEVRVVALGAALRVDALDQDRHVTALADEDPTVRYRAVELVARVPDNDVLARLVVDRLADEPLREVAAFVLGELALEEPTLHRAVEALEAQATEAEDPLCRESAVAALGALGYGLGSILAATEDVATVRRRAILALAPFDGPEVDAALERAKQDRDWQVRQAAEDLLG